MLVSWNENRRKAGNQPKFSEWSLSLLPTGWERASARQPGVLSRCFGWTARWYIRPQQKASGSADCRFCSLRPFASV